MDLRPKIAIAIFKCITLFIIKYKLFKILLIFNVSPQSR